MKMKRKSKSKRKTKKKTNTFSNNDLDSNNGMLTSVWGPSMWFTLHIISFNYPVKPTQYQKKEYFNFFKNLGYILPCSYCRLNYKKNIKSVKLDMSVMKNRKTLSIWLYNLHNEINKMLGKKFKLSYDEVRQNYEIFRARCLNPNEEEKYSKKIKELGCTKPFYGVKSKSVISIVPRNKKCKTFKIDNRCRIKR